MLSDIHSPLLPLLYSGVFFGKVIFISDNGVCSIKKGGSNTFVATCLMVRAAV